MKVKVHLFLFTVMLLYSGNYLVSKELMPSVLQPKAAVILRVLTGLIFFGLFTLLISKERIKRIDILLTAVCALFGVAINQLFFLEGIALAQPINASLIMITVPIMVMVFSYFILKKKITWVQLIGVIIGGTGAAVLITELQPLVSAQGSSKGDLFILINATSFALYLVLVKKLLEKYSPFTVAAYMFFFGLLFVTPFGFKDLMQTDFSLFLPYHWGALAYLLILTTIFAYMLYLSALKSASPTLVASYVYIQPILTSLLSIGFGKDELNMFTWIGGGLIFIGVFLVTSNLSKRK